MEKYTAMRKSREDFRNKLMKMIRQVDEEGGDTIPTTDEKNLLRYYYYLQYGIDNIYVAPLDKHTIAR